MQKPHVTADNIGPRSARWLEEIAEYNVHKMDLEINKAALLVIDMQNFFLDPQSPTYTEGGTAIIGGCRKLIDIFRGHGRPVIFTRHVHKSPELDGGNLAWWWQGMCIDGTPESKIMASLAPLKAEKIIDKHRYSAFYNTDLEITLRCLAIRDLVTCGIMSNICVESTVRDAFFRDLRCFVPADAVGSVSESLQIGALRGLAFGFALINRVEDITGAFRNQIPFRDK